MVISSRFLHSERLLLIFRYINQSRLCEDFCTLRYHTVATTFNFLMAFYTLVPGMQVIWLYRIATDTFSHLPNSRVLTVYQDKEDRNPWWEL